MRIATGEARRTADHARYSRPVRVKKTSSSVAPFTCSPAQRLALGELRTGPRAGRASTAATDVGRRPRPARPRAASRRLVDSAIAPSSTLIRTPASSPRIRAAGVSSSRIAAVVHDRDPVAERLGLVHVVRGEDDGAAVFVERAAADPRGCAAPAGRAPPSARRGRRPRGRARARRRSTAAAAARRTACSVRVSALSVEADPLEPLVCRRSRDAVQRGERVDLLARRQPVEERRRLELDADPRQQLRCCAATATAEQRHLTGVGGAQSLDDLEGRGLAGAVRSEDAEELSGLRLRTSRRRRRAGRRRTCADRRTAMTSPMWRDYTQPTLSARGPSRGARTFQIARLGSSTPSVR